MQWLPILSIWSSEEPSTWLGRAMNYGYGGGGTRHNENVRDLTAGSLMGAARTHESVEVLKGYPMNFATSLSYLNETVENY